ncbi:hypothetical protein [Okeania sp. SIO1I7]|uniref:hypothetical protein n=1 Tax=Okeania sp. SIO1I7 TaxID=2607772 RepID=UPI0013F9E595|nr:hypothetical protein [Okeania sp. SIO1I7]NET27161.1 hypothetical protein [Okeania sp. SIO1I7]
MKVWDIRSDVENFAAIHLTGDAETILDLYGCWPYFEGQKFGDTWPKNQAKFKTLNTPSGLTHLKWCIRWGMGRWGDGVTKKANALF